MIVSDAAGLLRWELGGGADGGQGAKTSPSENQRDTGAGASSCLQATQKEMEWAWLASPLEEYGGKPIVGVQLEDGAPLTRGSIPSNWSCTGEDSSLQRQSVFCLSPTQTPEGQTLGRGG